MIDILNAICETIAKEFKHNPIYIDSLPKDFKRPSFYIELVNSRDEDLNSTAQLREMSFQIMYFGERDDFDNVSTIELYSVWSILERIFYRALKVDEEDYKKIDSTDFVIKDDILIMTLRLEFGYSIKDNNLTSHEVYELMRELRLKYSYK